jgi:hypothetical protein
MRKNLNEDPDVTWTDREILFWAMRNGAIDEAHSLTPQNQQVQKSIIPLKDSR